MISAPGIGYQEEIAPTLKATASGNMMPSILCLTGHGGQRMDITTDMTPTLRARYKLYLLTAAPEGGSRLQFPRGQ